MQKRRKIQIALLIGLTIGVIALGYFSAGWIAKLLPSYEGEVIAMEDKSISQRLYGDNDQITLSPWIYYNPRNQRPLDSYQRNVLTKAGFNKAVNWLFEPGGHAEADFSYSTTAEYDPEADEYVDPFAYTIFLKGMEVEKKSTGVWYQVDCAVENGAFVYYHQRPRDQERAHREKLERAYRLLNQYIEEEKSGDIYGTHEAGMPGEQFISYLRQINRATAMFCSQQENRAYSKFTEDAIFGRIEGGYQIVDFDYDQIMQMYFEDVNNIYMTDQEVMVELTVSMARYHYEGKFRLVLFFDPVEWKFCGFSFQR